MSKEFKLVPARMLLDRATIGAILFHCGDGSAVDLEDCSEGLLWVGSVTDDDGKEVHGLHIATAEYPEEGSTTLVEFDAAPQPPALGGDLDGFDIEAAAQILADRMDYPWEHMPEQGRNSMRENARAVLRAALNKPAGVQS